MSAQQTFVIVGAGLAGAKAAEALRTNGFGGKVILIGDEADRPYDRPPLSKGYLLGTTEREKIYIHPTRWHTEHDIDLRLGTRVTEIDRAAHKVNTAQGETLGYDKLLLTTGSSPRRLEVPGADLAGVHYLRRVADSDALQAAFASAQRVAIIGAGWIGLETAAAARAAGCHVTLFERDKLPLLAVLGAEVAETYAALHRAHGVELRPGADAAEIIGAADKVTGVRLADGDVVQADTVVIGVGILPNIELAASAGLPIDNGVVVDEHLATIDPDVFAAGDVANTYYPLLGTHLRLEHWSAALNQGPVAAANMMGTATPSRQGALLLLRPIRQRHGVFRLRAARRLRRGRLPRRRRQRRIHRLLDEGRNSAGRHERQHMGCHRRHRGAGALRCATRPIEAGRPRGSFDGPDASALRSQRLPRSGPRTETKLDGGACCGQPTGSFRVVWV